MKSHAYRSTLLHRDLIIHVDVMAEERSLDQFHEFNRDYETDGNEGVQKNVVLPVGFHTDDCWVVDEVVRLG